LLLDVENEFGVNKFWGKELEQVLLHGKDSGTTVAVEFRGQRGMGVLYSLRAEAREIGFLLDIEISSSWFITTRDPLDSPLKNS
jgi:hypothetical protein